MSSTQFPKLSLDDKAFLLLYELKPSQGANVDSRIYRISIRNLLQHSGGWDLDQSHFDPMFKAKEIARAMKVPSPPSSSVIIRYMIGQPLQFDPGTEYSYSNFGYCVLGRIIEKISGETYESYVKNHILIPSGIDCMRLGRTLLVDRAKGEVRYYGSSGTSESVYAGENEPVPGPYGAWDIQAMDSHGGWLASSVDLLRFINAIDTRGRKPRILAQSTVELMLARPATPWWEGSSYWYGMGWNVRPMEDSANWWHKGSLDGTTTIMVRAYNGVAWVALFNSRSSNHLEFENELDDKLWVAVREVKEWPSHDLFNDFKSCLK